MLRFPLKTSAPLRPDPTETNCPPFLPELTLTDHETEVEKATVIPSMCTNKATGPDEIPALKIRLLYGYLAPSM